MKKTIMLCIVLGFPMWIVKVSAQKSQAVNPIIFADVPDMAIVRVGEVYYMSSTTMHMSPGIPIMKSNDLVNWKLINYVYDTLADVEALTLEGGKDAYGRGSWASCIRHHNGTYYVSTFAQTTGKTYIFTTKNIERGPWKRFSFEPSYHDHTLFFDDDGRVYLIYGGGKLRLVELNAEATEKKNRNSGNSCHRKRQRTCWRRHWSSGGRISIV